MIAFYDMARKKLERDLTGRGTSETQLTVSVISLWRSHCSVR